jgi:hypothetical protein
LYYVVQLVGSGDTVLLTRLSLLLIPQRPQEGYDGGGSEKSKGLDVKVSGESNGHVEKPTNGT